MKIDFDFNDKFFILILIFNENNQGTYLIKTKYIPEIFGQMIEHVKKIDRIEPFKILNIKEEEDEWYTDILFTKKCSTVTSIYMVNREKYGELMEKEREITKNKTFVDIYLFKENNYLWKIKFLNLNFFNFLRYKHNVKNFQLSSHNFNEQLNSHYFHLFKKRFCSEAVSELSSPHFNDFDDYQKIFDNFAENDLTSLLPYHKKVDSYAVFFSNNYTLEVEPNTSVLVIPLSEQILFDVSHHLNTSYAYFFQDLRSLNFSSLGLRKYCYIFEYKYEQHHLNE